VEAGGKKKKKGSKAQTQVGAEELTSGSARQKRGGEQWWGMWGMTWRVVSGGVV
jgi:hypothetical protein